MANTLDPNMTTLRYIVTKRRVKGLAVCDCLSATLVCAVTEKTSNFTNNFSDKND
ncbi:hypothetical protein [Novipirellula herctigrandis]|uniref:hypothetical protein n=1 Tax=Novipirellula herctigrandis TaxID=2527986 RepID=UPI003AF34FFD